MTEYLVVAGMSGAGRSSASATLEDLGWFVIDNLPAGSHWTPPPSLPGHPAALSWSVFASWSAVAELESSNEILPAVDALAQFVVLACKACIIFLDASDEVLVRRYEGTRRRHPLEAEWSA